MEKIIAVVRDRQKLNKLTVAEEKLMSVLWKLDEATISQLLIEYTKPVPARTTISTIVRILEKKGFICHKSYGRFYVYSPIVIRQEYCQFLLVDLIRSYFNNSFHELILFYLKEMKLNSEDIDELFSTIKKSISEIQNSCCII